jgi:NADH:ubiquinone reductase (non-electrogenic)
MSLVKALDAETAKRFDVVILSPRNYFLYTPLLPAVAAGTCEERSIVEPVRNLVVDKGVSFYEAVCTSVDTERRELVACFPKDAGLDEACFRMSYDLLVVGVGSVNNTFGIKGVDEHCVYFKTIDDALKLRRRVSECFERAALPATTESERRRLLSFVIVGGGPTGVEVNILLWFGQGHFRRRALELFFFFGRSRALTHMRPPDSQTKQTNNATQRNATQHRSPPSSTT